jgi:hypothetical protein
MAKNIAIPSVTVGVSARMTSILSTLCWRFSYRKKVTTAPKVITRNTKFWPANEIGGSKAALILSA